MAEARKLLEHAFPSPNDAAHYPGMTLRDYFAAQALANASICTGVAKNWQLDEWFPNRTGITQEEITTRQAFAYADAMLRARAQGEG